MRCCPSGLLQGVVTPLASCRFLVRHPAVGKGPLTCEDMTGCEYVSVDPGLASALRSPHPGFCWRNSSHAARPGGRFRDSGSSLAHRFAHEPHGTEEAVIARVSGLHPRVAG